MLKPLLTDIAALFLATGIVMEARANEEFVMQCDKKSIYVWGHHGWEL